MTWHDMTWHDMTWRDVTWRGHFLQQETYQKYFKPLPFVLPTQLTHNITQTIVDTGRSSNGDIPTITLINIALFLYVFLSLRNLPYGAATYLSGDHSQDNISLWFINIKRLSSCFSYCHPQHKADLKVVCVYVITRAINKLGITLKLGRPIFML